MAKGNKTDGATPIPLNAFVLFGIALLLLVAAAFMKSFPLLIFVGFAPLFAIIDKTKENEKFWNYAELILLALSLFTFAEHFFDFAFLIPSLIQSIILTLAFVGYAFARQSLGPRLGKLTILFFWLGFEYLFLKLHQSDHVLFLADTLQLQPKWLKWTYFTGYLGVSAWILVANLLLYHAVFKGQLNWLMFIAFLLMLAGPVAFSYTTDVNFVSRQQMAALYQNTEKTTDSLYADRGEFIPRTAAWISVLIFTFALIKNNIKKK